MPFIIFLIKIQVLVFIVFECLIFVFFLQSSSEIADAYVEPQPLWEYPSTPLTEQVALLHFDFTKPLSGLRTVNRQGYINFNRWGIDLLNFGEPVNMIL